MSSDRGSLSIEYVIITPVIFLVFGLIYAFGRVSAVDNSLDTGTRDAARAVSLVDPAQAHDVAYGAVRAELGNGTSTCASTLAVVVSPADFVAGETVTVQATCDYTLADVLQLPSVVGGKLTVHSQFSVVVDPNRSLG